MQNSTFQRDDLMPKTSDGTGRGFALATLVHIGLIIAIAFGVSWRVSEPEGVEAELWAAVPQVAAQRDVAPEPKPEPKPTPKPEPKPEPEPAPPPKVQAPDPQIAIEKEKQEKAKKVADAKREQEEKDKLEKKKALEDKAKLAKAEADKQKQLEDQRNKNLARIKDMMGVDGGSQNSTAARSAGPSAAYAGRIKARIKPNILLTDTVDGNPLAEVEVRVAPDGTILSSKLTKSSGVKAWDDAVLRAIEKTEILPRDTDGTIPPVMEIAFRPRDF